MTILTLTANPSTDRTVTLAGPLERGAVQRLLSVTMQAGGKGVNISRAAVSADLATEAVFPARPDDPFVHELTAAGIVCCPAPPAGDIRINLAITEPDGTTTKLNSPGATMSESHLADLAATLLDRAAGASWVVLAGSLPPGAPDGWYADLVRSLRRTRARVAVDTSEGPLSALVAAFPDAAPDLMKPNGEELASFVGGDAEDYEAQPEKAADAARQLIDQEVGAVLVTLGGARRRPGDRRGRVARHATAHHRGQHGGRGRLQSLRLPARRRARRDAPDASRWPSPTAARPPHYQVRPSPSPGRRIPNRYWCARWHPGWSLSPCRR